MSKQIDIEGQMNKAKAMVDSVLRTGEQQLKEVHLLQDLVNNAVVEIPDEIKDIVGEAAKAIEDRAEKLNDYLTNPKSKVSVADLCLTDVLDGLLERARDFVSSIEEDYDDEEMTEEESRMWSNILKLNDDELEKMTVLLNALPKLDAAELKDKDKFTLILETLVARLEERGKCLRRHMDSPNGQPVAIEDMTPYYMSLAEAAGPWFADALQYNLPDLFDKMNNTEDGGEDDDEGESEACKTVSVKLCDGELKVVTEGFTPEEHGKIERFFARTFDYQLELDEVLADVEDAGYNMEEELADYMNDSGFVKVPYVVDGTKYVVDIPLDTALNYWKSRGTDDSLLNLIGIIDLTRQTHKDIYGEYIPLSDKFKLDSEFTKCEGVYKLIYELNS